MNYIWDVFAVLIIGISIYIGVRRGFVRTIVTVLCYGASLVLAKIGAPILANTLYKNYLSERITQMISEQMLATIKAVGTTTGSEIMSNLPNWLTGIIESVYPAFGGMTFSIPEGAVANSDIFADVAQQINVSVSGLVITGMGWMFFILLFFLILFLLRWIGKLFTNINYIPLVGTVNMVLGGGLGAINGVIVLILILIVANFLIILNGNTIELFSRETIDSSFIMGILQKFIF